MKTVRVIFTPAVSAPEDRAHSLRIEVVAVYARTTQVSIASGASGDFFLEADYSATDRVGSIQNHSKPARKYTAEALANIALKDPYRSNNHAAAIGEMLEKSVESRSLAEVRKHSHDVPGDWFTGPF